ncbi:MAG: hypothetical protein IPF57_23290 [Gammaproteobacteria bacterium]|nr:hypothetical protein [Gammaproteobacteria bacterium]
MLDDRVPSLERSIEANLEEAAIFCRNAKALAKCGYRRPRTGLIAREKRPVE